MVSGYVFLCVTQVQKIRKALEKIGLEKEFQFMSMENLKVTKCWRVKDFKTQSSKCVRNAYLCVCVSGWFGGGVPGPGEESDFGVYSSKQPRLHRDGQKVQPGLCQKREGK